MSTQKIIIIHHNADFDGHCCRAIAEQYFGARAEYVGWDHGDPVPEIPEGVKLYMMDISIPALMDYPGLVWIDHHRSAMERFPANITGYRIDGVAACRLAWQWFQGLREGRLSMERLPAREDFAHRLVAEPLAVRLIGEYDIWDKRDPRVDIFQCGLRAMDIDWSELLAFDRMALPYVDHILTAGEYIAYSQAKGNAWLIGEMGFTLRWQGLTWLAVNAAGGNSALFEAGLKPEHQACMAFRWDGRKWRLSLRGAPAWPDVDLSAIAVAHGGGGHRQACGFECATLPFDLAPA